MNLTGQWPAGTILMMMIVGLCLVQWAGNPWGLHGYHSEDCPGAEFSRGLPEGIHYFISYRALVFHHNISKCVICYHFCDLAVLAVAYR